MFINDPAKQEVKIAKLQIKHEDGFYKGYTENFPYVGDDAIYVPAEPITPNGTASCYKALITKEIFVEAYNKWVKHNEIDVCPVETNSNTFVNGVKETDDYFTILNWYRNLNYKEEPNTEQGIMARAINDLFMALKAGTAEQKFKENC